jgi:hypothetical protein
MEIVDRYRDRTIQIDRHQIRDLGIVGVSGIAG